MNTLTRKDNMDIFDYEDLIDTADEIDRIINDSLSVPKEVSPDFSDAIDIFVKD